MAVTKIQKHIFLHGKEVNKTKEDFSLVSRHWEIGKKSALKVLMKRLTIG